MKLFIAILFLISLPGYAADESSFVMDQLTRVGLVDDQVELEGSLVSGSFVSSTVVPIQSGVTLRLRLPKACEPYALKVIGSSLEIKIVGQLDDYSYDLSGYTLELSGPIRCAVTDKD